MNFEKAKDIQWSWKTDEIIKAQCEIVKAGLLELEAGRLYFSSDNIPNNITFEGQGIVGSALSALRSAGIIVDCWLHDSSLGIIHGRRRSLRKSANGRKVQLYTLASRGIAESFLSKHEKTYLNGKQMVLSLL